MRILMLSHTCQSPTEGQPKTEYLAQMPELDMCVVVPDKWKHYGEWRPPEFVEPRCCHYVIGRVALPWVYLAQNYAHCYPELEQLLCEFRPDILDIWEEPWGVVSAHACWLCRRLFPQARIISETEQNINKHLYPPFESFRTYTLRQADFVIGRSVEAVEIVRRKGYTGPAQVVPNGVNAKLFHPFAPTDRQACRRQLGLSGFVAGYVGRIEDCKGLRDMVDALAYCPENVHLVFVGDGPYKHTLEEYVRTQGRQSQVRFLPHQKHEKLPFILNALDVLILPSRTTKRWKEQFGRVIIEAHACGIPVIGSASGAIPEVVGKGGFIVPEQNPRALAAAIQCLAEDRRLTVELGQIGRHQVEQAFTWERVACQMHDIYRRVLQA